jgi:hypothetical protein
MLCASSASTVVEHRGRQVPVCRIHEAKYARWGDAAAAHAETQWGWETEPEPDTPALAQRRDLAPTRG